MNAQIRRRREPRVRLTTRARLFGRSEDGFPFELEASTLNISPRGASVATSKAIPVGSVLRFLGVGYQFTARACVRSTRGDRETGRVALGLEFLDGARNPLVTWRGADAGDAPSPPQSDVQAWLDSLDDPETAAEDSDRPPADSDRVR